MGQGKRKGKFEDCSFDHPFFDSTTSVSILAEM